MENKKEKNNIPHKPMHVTAGALFKMYFWATARTESTFTAYACTKEGEKVMIYEIDQEIENWSYIYSKGDWEGGGKQGVRARVCVGQGGGGGGIESYRNASRCFRGGDVALIGQKLATDFQTRRCSTCPQNR